MNQSNHKTFDWKYLIFGGVILAIGAANFFLSRVDGFYNESTQVLFNIFLTAVSIWAGIFYSNKQAEKNASEKWMPAAESALKSLYVLKTIIERRQEKRGQEVDGGKVFVPFLKNGGDNSAVNAFLNYRCGECNETLLALKLQIMSSIKTWSVFLDINCNKRDSSDVKCRVEEFVEELQIVKKEKIVNFVKIGEELKNEVLE